MAFIKRKKEPFKEIQSCLQKRDYKEAVGWFKQLLEKDSKNTKIRLRYADTLVLAGSKKEAVKQYRRVADELAEAGFMIRAIAVSKKVTKLDPSQTDLHEKLAALNQEQSSIGAGSSLPLQAPGPLPDMEPLDADPPTIDMEPVGLEGQEEPKVQEAVVRGPMLREPTLREPTLSLEESMAMEFGDTAAPPAAEPPAVAEPQAPVLQPVNAGEEDLEIDLGEVGITVDESAEEELSFEEADVAQDASIPSTEFELVVPGAAEAEPISPELELSDEAPVFSEEPVSVSADEPPEPPTELADEQVEQVELEVIEASPIEEVQDIEDIEDIEDVEDVELSVDAEDMELGAEEEVLLEVEAEDVELEPDIEPEMAADGNNPLVGLLGDDIDSMIDSIIDDVGSSATEVPTPPSRQSTRIPLFSDLTPHEFVEVAIMLVRRPEKAGAVIVEEGAPGDSMFIVSTGEVEASRDRDGRSIRLATLRDGDFFGEMAILSGEPRTATVTAVKNTELLELARTDLQRICSRHPEVEAKLRLAYEERRQHTSA